MYIMFIQLIIKNELMASIIYNGTVIKALNNFKSQNNNLLLLKSCVISVIHIHFHIRKFFSKIFIRIETFFRNTEKNLHLFLKFFIYVNFEIF